MIKVLIVDDSALMRKKLREMLQADDGIEVIGTARDGLDGVQKAKDLKPDVITMDINMPRLDGISALQMIMDEAPCPVIIVSSLSQEGALITFEALELGAFDYVAKPGGTISLNLAETRHELVRKIKAAGDKGTMRRLKREMRQTARPRTERSVGAIIKERTDKVNLPAGEPQRAIAIGVSTGGPRTIMDILPLIPPNIGAPIFIVQHMPAAFTGSFAERLNAASQIPVYEAVAGMEVQNNVAYLARGGQHLLLRPTNAGKILIRLATLPQHLFIPSVDIMMESVLGVFGEHTLGVLLTGMGDDGAQAMLSIRKSGGYTIAESEETAIVWGMPREAIERGGAEIVLPSYEITAEIIRVMNRWKKT